MSANSQLAAAILDGDDRLSARDALICITYLYSGGIGAQTLLNSAIADGNDKLSDRDIVISISSILNP